MTLLTPLSSIVAQASTVPDSTGGPYVAAAYVVFVTLVAVYLAIMAQRLRRMARTADELEQRLDELERPAPPRPDAAAESRPVAAEQPVS